MIQTAIAADFEHVLIDVIDDGVLAASVHEPKCDIAGAAADIQQGHAGPGPELIDEGPFPQTMDTAAHQIVHQIVLRRDAVEYAAHQAAFVFFGHVAETEGRHAFRGSVCCRFGHFLGHDETIAEAIRNRYVVGMPELPEVETVRRGLAPYLEGQTIVRAVTRRPDLRIPLPEGFADRLEGRKIVSVDRQAKYLLVRLDDGAVVIIHLGMSGRMTAYADDVPAPGPHDHVDFVLGDGAVVRYRDPRRFGLMTLADATTLAAHPLLRHLGVDPLGNEFNAPMLAAAFKGRRSPLKAALLDQRIIAGLGNIYVCESLYRSRLSPKRKAGTVGRGRAEELVSAIRDTLRDAIAAGGSSLRDHAAPDGELGYFQHSFKVYGREGLPCPDCECDVVQTGGIRRIQQSGRSTFYCTRLQR